MKDLSALTDNQLVQAFRQGNSQALEVLIGRYKDRMFSAILFLVKDEYLAEDLFQDAFVKIIDNIRKGRYTDEGKFLPWAMRVAHNLCVDHFRKVKRTPSVLLSNNTDIFEQYSFVEEAPDQKVMRRDVGDKIHHMLNKLPAEQREVIVLRHYGDLSFKEIAVITKTSINTCLGRMRYGLINLRKLVAEKQISL